MKVFACANQKGGVGKTSVAFNLSAQHAHYGQPVSLHDLEHQGIALTGAAVGKKWIPKSS